MKILLIVISIIGLGLTIIPSIMVFAGEITLQSHKQLMLAGAILWLGTSPFWIKKQD